MTAPARYQVRRSAGLWAYERVLQRAGFTTIAGVDEAGRGACAGPLVVGAAVLPTGKRGEIESLADSKLLSAATRERVYDEILARALSWHVVVIGSETVDRLGLHVMNVEGMRRALAGLSVRPEYVLTDGFGVPGVAAPSLAVWKGDRVSASVAAASILAKVTRDRIMVELHESYPQYDFAGHKGYITAAHTRALARYGPCAEHRFSYVNVARLGHMSDRGSVKDGVVSGDMSTEELSHRVPPRTVRRLPASARSARMLQEPVIAGSEV